MPLWTDRGQGWVQCRDARADNSSVAFLCCPGPSLAKVADLRGPGRVVYALNTAYPRIKPDTWIGLDRMGCFDTRLWSEAFPKITRRFDDDNLKMRHHPNVHYADLEDAAAEEIFIRRDNASKFVWVKNSFVFALHFLIWSGHKTIHLVGCDMGGERDYYDDRKLTDEQRGNNRRLYDDLVRTLRRLHPIALRNGISIRSCTPDSPLNRFLPAAPIEKAIAECEQNLPASGPVKHVRDTERHLDRPVVAVLKSGGDYRPEHVHRLLRQLPECSVTVLTDLEWELSAGEHLQVRPLCHDWPGWWSKMELFRPDFMPGESFLYMDLDTAVCDLPDAFFKSPQSVVLAPFTREDSLAGHSIQSGFMFLRPEERALIWEKWIQNPEEHMRRFRGDQDAIASFIEKEPGFTTWQSLHPNAVASYKSNVLPRRNYEGSELREGDVKIICYHGQPRPWDVAPL